MKFFNGNGLFKKISVVVAILVGIFTFYWQASDRIETKINEAVASSEVKIVSSLSKFQRQQDTRYWMQLREMARIETQRIDRGLAHHPNDLGLKSEKRYWEEVYDKATKELNKLLSS